MMPLPYPMFKYFFPQFCVFTFLSVQNLIDTFTFIIFGTNSHFKRTGLHVNWLVEVNNNKLVGFLYFSHL